jgi:hypothetical protein
MDHNAQRMNGTNVASIPPPQLLESRDERTSRRRQDREPLGSSARGYLAIFGYRVNALDMQFGWHRDGFPGVAGSAKALQRNLAWYGHYKINGAGCLNHLQPVRKG